MIEDQRQSIGEGLTEFPSLAFFEKYRFAPDELGIPAQVFDGAQGAEGGCYRADFEDRQVSGYPEQGVLTEQSYPVAGLNAQGYKLACQPGRGLPYLAVGINALFGNNSDAMLLRVLE